MSCKNETAHIAWFCGEKHRQVVREGRDSFLQSQCLIIAENLFTFKQFNIFTLQKQKLHNYLTLQFWTILVIWSFLFIWFTPTTTFEWSALQIKSTFSAHHNTWVWWCYWCYISLPDTHTRPLDPAHGSCGSYSLWYRKMPRSLSV